MKYLTGALVSFHDLIPDGFLLCNGGMVSRVDYSELFNVVGDFYGKGDGSTTFTLPLFDNIFFRQIDENTEVGTYLLNDYKKHTHNVTLLEGGDHSTHAVPEVGTRWWEAGGFGGYIEMGEGDNNPYKEYKVSLDGSLHSHGIEIDNYEGAKENYPAHRRYLWGIKY